MRYRRENIRPIMNSRLLLNTAKQSTSLPWVTPNQIAIEMQNQASFLFPKQPTSFLEIENQSHKKDTKWSPSAWHQSRFYEKGNLHFFQHAYNCLLMPGTMRVG